MSRYRVIWVLVLLTGILSALRASQPVQARPTFPTMDYVLDKLPDGRTRVIFHVRYAGSTTTGCIPYLGYTVDTAETWLRVTAWYDIRDVQKGIPCERHDTVYYATGGPDSVRLVTASIYRDSLQYPFARDDWNRADSFYFFSRTARDTAPYAYRIRLLPDRQAQKLTILNPAKMPLRSIEVLTVTGQRVQRESGTVRSFSVARLLPGFYFVRFLSDYGNQVEIAIVNP